MAAQATGTFTVSGWDENTYSELDDGGKLTKAHVTFGFDGDLKGEGGWEAVMCYGRTARRPSPASSARSARSPAARAASWSARTGRYGDGEARTDWQVVDGSATGELRGLRGTGYGRHHQRIGRDFTLDYELA